MDRLSEVAFVGEEGGEFRMRALSFRNGEALEVEDGVEGVFMGVHPEHKLVSPMKIMRKIARKRTFEVSCVFCQFHSTQTLC